MVINGDVISLKREEVKELVNKECMDKFGINAAEFIQRYRRGELSPDEASSIHKIKMLLRLAYK